MTEALPRPVKVVVWDLDNTLWDGTLLEDGEVRPRAHLTEVIRELDRRGVLHSVASRNEPADAIAALDRMGLADYFLCPQIGWGSKADAIATISKRLNLGLDSFVFVDDEPIERAEVAHFLPQVRCITPDEASQLLVRPNLVPTAVTAESANRRKLYAGDAARSAAEEEFGGSRTDFLRSLDMRLVLARAQPADLDRIQELTLRTNQLNSTGRVFEQEALRACLDSERHDAVIADLTDRFGPYGKIGFVLTEKSADSWLIKLVLTSCRVMSRGIGGVLLQATAARAAAAGVPLRAEYVDTGRNRPMYLAFRFAGFRRLEQPAADGPVDRPVLLERDPALEPPLPDFLTIQWPAS